MKVLRVMKKVEKRKENSLQMLCSKALETITFKDYLTQEGKLILISKSCTN